MNRCELNFFCFHFVCSHHKKNDIGNQLSEIFAVEPAHLTLRMFELFASIFLFDIQVIAESDLVHFRIPNMKEK